MKYKYDCGLASNVVICTNSTICRENMSQC